MLAISCVVIVSSFYSVDSCFGVLLSVSFSEDMVVSWFDIMTKQVVNKKIHTIPELHAIIEWFRKQINCKIFDL